MSRDSLWNQHRREAVRQTLHDLDCYARLTEVDPQTGSNLVCYRSKKTMRLGVYRILERGQFTDSYTGKPIKRLKLGRVDGKTFDDGAEGFWVSENQVIFEKPKTEGK